MKDLFVLTADQDMLTTIDRLLKRPQSLSIRPVHYAAARHRYRDPGRRIGEGGSADLSRRIRSIGGYGLRARLRVPRFRGTNGHSASLVSGSELMITSVTV